MTNVFSKIWRVFLRSSIILASTLSVFLPSTTNHSRPIDATVAIEWLMWAAPAPAVLVFGSIASACSMKTTARILRVGMSLAGFPFLIELSQKFGIGVAAVAAVPWTLVMDWMYWASTKDEEDAELEGYSTQVKQLTDVIGHLRGTRPSEVIPMTTGGHNGNLLSLSSVQPHLTLNTQTYDPELDSEALECRPLLHGEEGILV